LAAPDAASSKNQSQEGLNRAGRRPSCAGHRQTAKMPDFLASHSNTHGM
ncbi:hypothetical protein A2U01_0074244, partial [Trifolium medium]|nr:hypothetical protein [Trifolium medium]